MSRREAKLANKKQKKQLILFLALTFIFLWVGIMAVDYAVRDMLGIEDTRVLGVETGQEEYILYTLGNIRHINRDMVEGKVQDIQQQLYNLVERIKNVGANRHFFSSNYQL